MTDKQFHPVVVKRINEVIRTSATELDLSGLQLSDVPETIRELKELRSLDLSKNRLI